MFIKVISLYGYIVNWIIWSTMFTQNDDGNCYIIIIIHNQSSLSLWLHC